MHYIGLISGTSMDAVDAAMVLFEDDRPTDVQYRQFPLDARVRQRLRRLDEHTALAAAAAMDAELGHLFASAANALMADAGLAPDQVRAIGSHGQTILHFPDRDPPFTAQIGDPNVIARETGVTTVADFRRMDMAAGGQGAPFAPAFHAFQFRSGESDRVVLNIGGIANVTLLPADASTPVTGFDTGPGNGLMDDWIHEKQGKPRDEDGKWAAGGSVSDALLAALLADAYFGQPVPKSTGRDYFNLAWLKRSLDSMDAPPSDVDVQATLLQLTARTIADAITAGMAGADVLVCGGGVHNPALMDALRAALPGVNVNSTAAAGIDPDAVEAVTFAWLAKQRLEGKPGNLPSVTGARDAVPCGAVYEPVPSNEP